MKHVSIMTLLMTLTGFLSGCGKESFTSVPRSQSNTANSIETFEQLTCSNHSLVKPPVDILYVVDNSSSSSYLTQDLKNQIANTINTISSEFDYHVLVAPLLAVPGEANLTSFQLVTSSLNGLVNPNSLNIKSPSQVQFFSTVTGNNQEHGFKRIKDIINANRTNGIFRQKAYTMVVMISNGDDTEVTQSVGGYQVPDPAKIQAYKTLFEQYTKKYADTVTNQSVKNGLLQAEKFRLFSVVTHTACLAGAKANQFYKDMSLHLYGYSNSNDQAGRSTPDSYDMCTGAYATLFEGINNSIKQFILGHKYDYWLITNNTAANIDVNDIQVFKVKATGAQVAIAPSNSNGFVYVGARTNQNTRYEPTPGEPATGLMIQLFGSARVEYPDCMVVKTRTPTEYFGFIVLAQEPKVESIVVRVRGQNVPQGGANGWEYQGFSELQNIKIPGPNGEPNTPALLKTGYFIKLNGSSIYSSGDTVEVYFDAAPL
jgi:hypothetical protein